MHFTAALPIGRTPTLQPGPAAHRLGMRNSLRKVREQLVEVSVELAEPLRTSKASRRITQYRGERALAGALQGGFLARWDVFHCSRHQPLRSEAVALAHLCDTGEHLIGAHRLGALRKPRDTQSQVSDDGYGWGSVTASHCVLVQIACRRRRVYAHLLEARCILQLGHVVPVSTGSRAHPSASCDEVRRETRKWLQLQLTEFRARAGRSSPAWRRRRRSRPSSGHCAGRRSQSSCGWLG